MEDNKKTNEYDDILYERDHKLAEFIDSLDKVIIEEEKKQELRNKFNKIVDLVLIIETKRGIERKKTEKWFKGFYWSLMALFEAKHIRLLFITFIMGLLVSLIPSLFFIHSLQQEEISFKFIPNAMAERKPIYLQILDTPEKLAAVKKYNIYSTEKPVIGSAVGLARNGLAVFLKRELELPEVHLKTIPPQESERVNINGYEYIPDTILTRDPSAIQILYDATQVDAAKRWEELTYKEYLSIGAAIDCPNGIPCYVISSVSVQDRLIIKPFNLSSPNS